jgi:hypothetical protein
VLRACEAGLRAHFDAKVIREWRRAFARGADPGGSAVSARVQCGAARVGEEAACAVFMMPVSAPSVRPSAFDSRREVGAEHFLERPGQDLTDDVVVLGFAQQAGGTASERMG